MSLLYVDDDNTNEQLSEKRQQFIRNRVAKTNFDDIFTKKILMRNIYIKANQFNKNIDKNLTDILNNEVSGYCIEEGYVKPNSCKILLKSEGNVNISNFKGTIYYTVRYEALICNPQEGQKIKCFVSDVNKTNIRGYVISLEESPLNIFLPKQHNIGNDEYMQIKEGDLINILITNKKFEYLDKEILVIANFLNIIK